MKYFVVDVFSEENFSGNPAGVCICDRFPSAETMQKIAFENGLPETAFVVLDKNKGNQIKWFTPEEEMDLCGHATLGSAFAVMNYINTNENSIVFDSNSGVLSVKKDDSVYYMDLPSRPPIFEKIHEKLEGAIGAKVIETRLSRDLIVLLEDETTVKKLMVDLKLLNEIGYANYVFTAKGDSCDFVSRFFTPYAMIPEDPVTGSAHCSLIPFWKEKLGKIDMTAKQLSQRGGMLFCKDCGERVIIGGFAKIYLIGEILVDELI